MPGLDLLAENDPDAWRGVFLLQQRVDGAVEGLELLGAEGADVVEVEFEGVGGEGGGGGCGGEELAREFGVDCHCRNIKGVFLLQGRNEVMRKMGLGGVDISLQCLQEVHMHMHHELEYGASCTLAGSIASLLAYR